MKINCNELKPGMAIIFKNKLYRVVKTQHVKPGKGGAYIQTELKGIIENTKLYERFRSSETIEKAFLEQKKCTFSYAVDDELHFLENETYDDIILNKSDIPEHQINYLIDNLPVQISFFEEKAIGIILPASIELEVLETEPYIKGQTITTSFKGATLTNNVIVQVPQHIVPGDKILVKTDDNTYSSKAK